MKRYTLLVFLFLTMLVTAVRAEVVVYKGTLRIKLDAGDALTYPPLVRLYFLVDYSTGETARVFYWVKNGKHLQKFNQAVNLSTGTLPNAKPITILATGESTNTALSDFYYAFSIMRGVNAVLKVESEPGTSTLVRPRILTGYGAYTKANDASDGRFQEGTYHLVFNSALTLDANNADKSLATMRDEIAGRLAAQGYED